jgi:hypothetical protein
MSYRAGVKSKWPFVFVSLAAALAGCGGGGSDPPAATASAQGAYSGSLSGSPSNAAFSAIVLEDGQLWTLYGNSVGGSLIVNGFIQGQGSSSGGVFTASALRDFGTSPSTVASVSVNYVAGASISGTLTELGVNLGINGTAIPAANFNYDAPASLPSIAGNWTLSSVGGTILPLSIAATGAANGVSSTGCAVSGTFTPRPSGKNVFNLALTFGPSPCPLPGGSAGGIAIYSTLSSGAHQLITAAVDPTRSFGNVAFGTR